MPGGNSWFALLWVVVCAALIIGLAYWFTKYVAAQGKLGSFGMAKGAEQFKVLARLSLGKEQMLVLVQVGGRYLLLGVTHSAISTVAELTAEEAETWTKPPDQPPPPTFREALRTVLQQKRQR